MVPNRIQVAMGEGVVASAPHIVLSSGLGSCVAVVLYDAQRRIGGLAHIMLPDSASVNGRRSPYQCADTAIAVLLERLQSRGAVRRGIVAKMVGGARMFSCYESPNTGIGDQNITSVKHILRREQIALIGEDTGGHHGRSVEFHLDSGRVVVTAIGRGERKI
jgi:chemotaxis protein CheD